MDSCKSFFLAFCELCFVYDFSFGTVCPSELSLCVNPERNFWHICSGRKTLQCPTGCHPPPGCSNSGKISSSWTKYTECKNSCRPTFRYLISEAGVAMLGFMQTDLHSSAAPAFQCFIVPVLFRLTWENPKQNLFPFFPPACLCYSTWPPLT